MAKKNSAPLRFRFSSGKLSESTLPKGTALIRFSEGKERLTSLSPKGAKIITIGIGERKAITRRKLILLFRQAVAVAKSERAHRLLLRLPDLTFSHLKISNYDFGRLLGENCEMANFEFVKYKTPPPEGWSFLDEISLYGTSKQTQEGVRDGQIVGREVNNCRALANTPGGEMTPQILARAARDAVKGTGVSVKILDKKAIERLGMGGVLGVSRGSSEEPRFIILEYKKGGKEKPIVLVGKGVTFDTGGLNLKPSDYIYEMHMDMSGGASVIFSIAAAARLGLKKNIVGLIPAVENMPSGSSYHPGDILRSLSGKTIEVLNTDAEGRVILADGLTYAKRFKPRLVVDIATLTGAASVALGQRASAIFTRDEKLQSFLSKLGEESGDYVWPLPLWEEYEEEVKGTFGDVANIGKTRYGGAITGAIFLYEFAKELPWVHIDMAPRMTAIEGEHLAKGAAGAPVRLLVRLLEKK